MANTTTVSARIDKELKENAENILSKLGISSSSAIQMLYSQIVLQRGIPFELKLPVNKPDSISNIDNLLTKGFESLDSDNGHSVDEVDEILLNDSL